MCRFGKEGTIQQRMRADIAITMSLWEVSSAVQRLLGERKTNPKSKTAEPRCFVEDVRIVLNASVVPARSIAEI